MRIGIFARTFQRPTVEEVLDAVVEQESVTSSST